ncbi:MAG: hypothetical protein KDK66_02725 [Deltaproteobacteria bacterium]|nr:hypothetical protein [Deltaproteobacteria bacterium]
MKKKSLFTLITAGILLSSTPSIAGYTCIGKVNAIAIRYNAVVAVDFVQSASSPNNFTGAFNGVGLCALEGAATSYLGPESCKGILSLLSSAKALQNEVAISFNDGNPGEEAVKCPLKNNDLSAAASAYTVKLFQ